MGQEIYFSNSPHVKSGNSTKKIMLHVIIALFPSCIAGCLFFGVKALLVLAIAVLSAVGAEFAYYLILGRNLKDIAKQFDNSTIVTGMILGLILGPNIPWYVPMLASVFAIVVVKLFFGGTGKNIVNPAATGRVFAFLSFGALLATSYFPPTFLTFINSPASSVLESGATNLSPLLNIDPNLYGGASGVSAISNLDLFLGTGVAGSIGETCKIAIIIGYIYLVLVKVIDFRWPLLYVLVSGLFAVCLNGFDFSLFLPSILSGGLIFAAVFMITDYTTSPNTKLGCYVYYVALALLTAGLRKATGIEIISFAILLMNLFVPLIDKYIINKPFGKTKEKQNKETK